MAENFANNYTAKLTTQCEIADGTISVDTVAKAPPVSFRLIVGKVNPEIMLCSVVGSGVLTVDRAQEDTTAQVWPVGTEIAAGVTAASLALFARVADQVDVASDDALLAGLNLVDQSGDPTAPATGHHILYPKAGGVYVEDHAGTVVGPLGPTGMTNPLTTQDDLLIGGASGAPARLAKGSDSQVLTVDPSTHHLVWASPAAAGMTNPMTTAGDIILGGTSGAAGRLAKGSDTQVLTVDPTSHLPVWAAPTSGGMTDPTTTKGDLIVHGSSTTRLAVGTDGQVLTADSTQTAGVKWAAAGSGGGGGALVLLEQHTASNSATLDFTAAISSTYDDYQIEIVNILPATNADQLLLRYSTDGGSTYIATGYQWAHMFVYGANTNGWEANNGAGSDISVGGGSVGSSGPGICGTIRCYGPLLSGTVMRGVTMDTIRYHSSLSTIIHDGMSSGCLSCAAVTALRFVFSGGNVASGTIRIYGIAKA